MVEQNQNKDLAELLVGMTKVPVEAGQHYVSGLTLDSRQADKGFLFIALAKKVEQRFAHMEQALEAGCHQVLFDSALALTQGEQELLARFEANAFTVGQLASKTSEIAGRFYGHPSLALKVIAITGTNGKTSVSQFIAQCLGNLGQPCGVIGTLGVGRINQLSDTGMTTPDPVTLQAILAEFCQQSVPYVVIEASSHALEQGRLNNVAIDVAVLTNLTRDHLDYHQDIESYAAAKMRLFEFDSLKTAVVNNSDKFGQSVIELLAQKERKAILSYSSTEQAMLKASHIEAIHSGLRFSVEFDGLEQTVESSLLGRFNVDNLLAVMGSLLAVEFEFDQIASLLSQCHSVEGRMEVYGDEHYAQIVIDYAHTPDALEQALTSLRNHVSDQGQLWCVFGCGGNRDIGKRALMGASAEQNADKLILTADNPRNEQNEAIVAAILHGINNADSVHIEHDRTEAIRYAINHADKEDIVLVAGKGHESYQEVGGVKLPYSDEHVVKACLAELNPDQGVMQ